MEFGVSRRKHKKLSEGAGALLALLRGESESGEISTQSDPNFEEIKPLNDKPLPNFDNNDDDKLASSEIQDVINDVYHQDEQPSFQENEMQADFGSKDSEIVETRVVSEAEVVQDSGNQPEPVIFKPVEYFDYNFDLSKRPVELIREQDAFKSPKNNFLKGCKWSPDGLHLLTNSEDRFLRAFALPEELHTEFKTSNGENDQNLFNSMDEEPQDINQKTLSLSSINKFNAGDLIYDFCWYPYVSYPNTCCTLFAYTSKDRPIHLRDINKSDLVASFTPINHLDEVSCSNSLCFSTDGCKLYAGFRNCVRIFDFCRPGRQISDKDTRGVKQLGNGQTGIISCIAASPTQRGVYVCGSYSKTIALYSDDLKDPQFVLQGHLGGVTHIVYHPNGNLIYSGGRKDNEILCWDLRQLGEILCVFEREVDTNQRIYFDIDKNGKYLITGNSDGKIKIWDLNNPSNRITFEAHDDCINGVSFNPFAPLIATSSGQRRYANEFLDKFIDDDDNSNVNNLYKCDNSVKIWKFA